MTGYKFKAMAAGIKKNGGMDLGIIVSERPASAAALFTKNRIVAAPVIVGREKIRSGLCQAVVVNSGNANCFTGQGGIDACNRTASLAAEALGIPAEMVMVASTGVIGAPLPMDKIETAMPELTSGLSADAMEDFATAILTTDTCTKIATRTGTIKGKNFSVSGVAKGSGMIRPDMATMLAFVVTDIDMSSVVLKSFLSKSCDRSFNRISVDGDTSTNDMVLAMANAASGVVIEDSDDALIFQKALDAVMTDLSIMIVRDGEGATKVVHLTVCGAQTQGDAFLAAETIAHSNLVKTAIYGEDPNWGRIVAAAGRSGARIDQSTIDLRFGEVYLVKQGQWLGSQAEAEAARVMKNQDLFITLDLNLGAFEETFLFCDFSEKYVSINADYRS